MTHMRQRPANESRELIDALSGVEEVIRRSLGTRRGMFDPADLEDLRSEVMLRLVRRLHDPDANPIDDIASYAAVVTFHVVDDYVRKRHPERARLANRIRFTLTRDARFALWEIDGELVAGLRKWSGRHAAFVTATLVSHTDIPGSLLRVFTSTNAPVAFHALVSLFWKSTGEPRVSSLEAVAPPRQEPPEISGRLWSEILALPVRQRIALLLHLRDESRDTPLVHLGVDGAELAKALEMTEDELRVLWPDLPLDDNRIAARLGATRQQVINLRKCARERLARRMAKW